VTEEDEQRRHWRLVWLSSLHAFSDSDTLRKRWLDPTEQNPHFSFVECICSYFDDANLGEENAYEKRLAEGDVGAEEVTAVAEFHSLAESYDSPSGDNYDHEAILRDEKWQEVVDAAGRSRQRLL